MWTALLAAAVLGPPILWAALWLFGPFRAVVRSDPLGNMAIVAAHPDDCLIMAGEFAIDSLRVGHSVQVIYLTCGDALPTSERANTRRRESALAWQMAGLARSNLHYCDLSESTLEGPLRASEDELSRAGTRLEAFFANLPAGAAVIIPAAGEQHVDHRMTRMLALEMAIRCGRGDLRFFEAAEYNVYYSLLHSPGKSLVYVLTLLPLIGHFISGRGSSLTGGFISGGRAWRLAPDAKRIVQKQEMLRQFRSENGELLVRLFGRPDNIRPIPDPKNACEDRTRGYVRVGERRLAFSIVLLWCWVFALLVGGPLWLSRTILAAHGARQGIAVVMTMGLSSYALLRKHPVEKRLVWLCLAVGVLIGAFA